MTRPGRPRWGLFSTLDVLLDANLFVGLIVYVNNRLDHRDAVGAGYAIAGASFVLGTSLLVRGALLPMLREQRTRRRQRRT